MPLAQNNAPAEQYMAYAQRFSSLYLQTNPADYDNLYMDMELPDHSIPFSKLAWTTGNIGFSYLLSNVGSDTTSASIGDPIVITHNLGFVPNFITITETSDGTVYLDATAATETTFSVYGSAASLTFNWKAE